MHRPLLFAALAACSTPEDASPPAVDSGEADQELPSAWEFDGDEGGDVDYDPAAMEAALGEVLAQVLTLSGQPVLDAYEQVFAEADSACPSWYEFDGNTYWLATCTARTGARFDGYGFYYVYESEDVFGDGNLWDLVQLSGAATIESSSGQTFHLGGYAYTGQTTHTGSYGESGWVSTIFGSAQWDGAERGWLAEGVSPSLLLYAFDYPVPYEGKYVYIEGTVGGLAGGASAAEFDLFQMADTSLGMPCDQEPSGSVVLRDQSGVWYEVVFDIDPYTLELSGDCDGCGAVFRGAELVGEACADFSRFLSWEDQPW